MITCVLKGGLGNQLFQIFAIISYAIKNGHSFIFKYGSHVNIGLKRKLYWDDFLVSLKVFTTINNKYNYSNEDLEKFPPIYLSQHHYQPMPIISKNENILFDSYFQSYRYFEEEEEKIFSFIRLDSQMKIIKNNYDYLFNDNYTISIHFRLGDYKNLQDYHNILPYEYYEKSIYNILESLEDSQTLSIPASSSRQVCDFSVSAPSSTPPLLKTLSSSLSTPPLLQKIRIIYFCEEEDIEYVTHIINRLQTISSPASTSRQVCDFRGSVPSATTPLLQNIEFTRASNSMEDWQQLLLMSCCDSNIIANSSYSWWGAYFNRNKEKIVCYPSQWFGPHLSHNILFDMFPNVKGWHKIDI